MTEKFTIRELKFLCKKRGIKGYSYLKKDDLILYCKSDRYWENISKHKKLSEKFIEKFQNRVDWKYISKYQKLSEKFIAKFQDKVDWKYISKYQKLSEKFIGKFLSHIDWEYISKYQKVFKKMIKNPNYIIFIFRQKVSEKFIEG